MNSRIITFSGVHGVGKSTIIKNLHAYMNFEEGVERPKNYFKTPFEAMLFFIAAFSNRDRNLKNRKNITYVLDRYSFLDIKVYLDALKELSYLNNEEYTSLVSVLNFSYSKKINPDNSFLLDDKPENILHRIEKFREPSKHHIFERDIRFIKVLREKFIENYHDLKDKSIQRFHIISVDFRDPSIIAKEVYLIINGNISSEKLKEYRHG